MSNEMITAVKGWLEEIMPSIVDSLVETLTPEVLAEMRNEEGIHGPISVDLEELGAPITALNFYITVVNDAILLAIRADLKNPPEDLTPEINFKHFFPINEFPTSIKEAYTLEELIDGIMEQINK